LHNSDKNSGYPPTKTKDKSIGKEGVDVEDVAGESDEDESDEDEVGEEEEDWGKENVDVWWRTDAY